MTAGALISAVLCGIFCCAASRDFPSRSLKKCGRATYANLLMSPLRPAEFVVALMVMSLIRLAVGIVPVTLMAIVFFGFNLWALGFAFAAFFVVLIVFAWSIKLASFRFPFCATVWGLKVLPGR